MKSPNIMRNFILSSITIVLFSLTATSQQIDSLRPIANKFNNLIESSNTFKGYKVVDQEELTDLQKETSLYIQNLKAQIEESDKAVLAQEQNMAQLQAELASVNAQLEEVKAEKDAIEFLGMPFSKATYKSLMWSIVGVLVLALAFFVYRFKKGNSTTMEAKKRMLETEKEFEAYRAKSLEKEQKLGRMLQDERNRHAHKAG